MPIKPENRRRYPPDWPEIRARILARAHDRCERCGVPNGVYRNNTTGEITDSPLQAEVWTFVDRDSVARIVLTIAHLDHVPEHCDDANLRAWCQRCHLTNDLAHHLKTAYATRRQGRAVGDLFGGGTDGA